MSAKRLRKKDSLLNSPARGMVVRCGASPALIWKVHPGQAVAFPIVPRGADRLIHDVDVDDTSRLTCNLGGARYVVRISAPQVVDTSSAAMVGPALAGLVFAVREATERARRS